MEGGLGPPGQFSFLPIHATARLTLLLRQRIVGLFLKLGLITEQPSETLLCGRRSGFSVDNSVRLDSGDHTARQALAQYEWSRGRSPPYHSSGTPHGARNGGRAHLTSRVSPPRGGASPMRSRCPPQAKATEPTTVSHATCRSAWARLIAIKTPKAALFVVRWKLRK